MRFMVDTFALLSAFAGWFYLFYSKAATNLSSIESKRQNTWRSRFRRVNGLAMFLLAIGFFAGFNTVDDQQTPRAFFAVWLSVMLLLFLVTVLVLIDVRLTWKLRHAMTNKERR